MNISSRHSCGGDMRALAILATWAGQMEMMDLSSQDDGFKFSGKSSGIGSKSHNPILP